MDPRSPQKIYLTPRSVSLCGVWLQTVLACEVLANFQFRKFNFLTPRSVSLCGVTYFANIYGEKIS